MAFLSEYMRITQLKLVWLHVSIVPSLHYWPLHARVADDQSKCQVVSLVTPVSDKPV